LRLSKSVISLITALRKKTLSGDKPVDMQGSDYGVDAYVLTDVGCYREHNEDCIVYIRPADASQLIAKGLLAIVADGMGGHQAGEVASQMAVDIIRRHYYEQSQTKPLKALKQAFIDANRVIHQASTEELSLRGMGTTATALLLVGNQVYFAHVGDSRLYRLYEGELSLLTEDHTLIMEMLKSGLLSPEEARFHPHKNIITRALGTHPRVTIATSQALQPVRIGDHFILCSDGLYDLVEDDEIKMTVLSATPAFACQQLITLARERGGYDNISVGILAVQRE
jgi:protein phosphatase